MASHDYILRITAKTLSHGGTASNINNEKFLPAMDLWSFPKYPSKTHILPPNADLVMALTKFIYLNKTLLSQADCWLGTWVNPQTREIYLDIATGIPDLKEAIALAKKISIEDGRKIVAIFNAKLNKTIYLWEVKI